MNATMKRFHMKGEVKGSARKIIKVLTSVMYNVYLGFYPPSAVMQFFQKTLVFPVVTNKAFAQASIQMFNRTWRKFAKKDSNVMYLRKYARLPALDEEIKGKVTRRIQNIVMFLFNSQDTDSVVFAFLAGYFEAKNAGLPDSTAISRGEEVARRTMFIYSKVFRSVATRSTVGRALSMFTSFPLNFAEFLLDLGKGNRSQVYIDYFKKHPELLNESNKKLVKKSGKGLLKYLLILAVAWYIEYKTRIKAMRYIGIDSFTNLLYYNPAFATLPIGIGKAVVSLLVNQDVKTFKSEMKKLTPVQIVACLRLLRYLGIKVDNEFLKYFFREDQQKDISRLFFYMKPLPKKKKIEVPTGRGEREGLPTRGGKR